MKYIKTKKKEEKDPGGAQAPTWVRPCSLGTFD